MTDEEIDMERFEKFKEWNKLTEDLLRSGDMMTIFSLVISLGIIDKHVYPRD